jgi:hypothetical protein
VEGGGEIAAETVAGAALLEGGVAEAVIGRALLFILQDVIGFVDLKVPQACADSCQMPYRQRVRALISSSLAVRAISRTS